MVPKWPHRYDITYTWNAQTMSSKIVGLIPRQGFELIRDRICQILSEEFEMQLILGGDYDLRFDKTELPSINVGLERGDEESSHQGQSEWTYRYWIEINTRGENEDDSRGDTQSKIKVQKIMGIARAILENPVYKTLGFPAGQLIRHRHVESYVFAEPTKQDADNCTMARMILVVKSIETTELLEAKLLSNWNTTVKLHETEKGYYWSKQTPWILETGSWNDEGMWFDNEKWKDD